MAASILCVVFECVCVRVAILTSIHLHPFISLLCLFKNIKQGRAYFHTSFPASPADDVNASASLSWSSCVVYLVYSLKTLALSSVVEILGFLNPLAVVGPWFLPCLIWMLHFRLISSFDSCRPSRGVFPVPSATSADSLSPVLRHRIQIVNNSVSLDLFVIPVLSLCAIWRTQKTNIVWVNFLK